MKRREGGGTILLIGFAIAVIIMTLAPYMLPPTITTQQEEVHEEFSDVLSYMTSVMETASRLPGTTSEKIDFITKQFSALERDLSERGIYFACTNLTMPLAGGKGENIVLFFTLLKGDTHFTGLLATNLTDLQKGIGSIVGGGIKSTFPSSSESLEDCIPIKTFPAFVVLYTGHPGEEWGEEWGQWPPSNPPAYGLRMIRVFLFNMRPEDYHLTMELEIQTLFDVKRGMYINFQPMYRKVFNSLEGQEFFISAREKGVTGLAFLHVKLLPKGPSNGYLNIKPQASPDSECYGTNSVNIIVTNDWKEYRELQLQAIREGIQNLIGWLKAGSNG